MTPAPRALAALALFTLAVPASLAQQMRFSPVLSVEEYYTDNVTLAPRETARGAWVTDLAPGLRFDHVGARARVHVDFRLHDLYHAGESQLDTTQRFLDARGTLEAVDDRVFVDAAARRNQQSRSPFGTAVAPDGASTSANRVETSVLQASPWLRGELPDVVAYRLRFTGSEIRTENDFLVRSRVSEWAGRLRNPSPSSRFGWIADATSLTLRNDAVGSLDNARARLALLMEVAPQLQLSVSHGRERTDFAGPERVEHSTPGIGVAWVPSNRTEFIGTYEDRFFGRGHNVLFSHRTALTVWRLRSVRDAVVAPALLQGSVGAPYGLFYDLLASAVPDREARAEAARRRLDESGLPATSIIDNGFLSERPFLQHELEASVAFVGARNTVTVSFARRDRQPLGPGITGGVVPPREDVDQRGLTGAWAYRLTPLTTLTLAATELRTEGEGAGVTGTASSRQRYGTLTLSTRLGPRTTASIGLRRTDFDSNVASDYVDNAFVINIAYRP